MEAITALLFFALLSMFVAVWQARLEDRGFLFGLMLASWVVFVPPMILINDWMPLSSGGDDENYYTLATHTIGAWGELFDSMAFSGDMEQMGYPWLLSAINLIFAPGLYGLKLFNLLLLQLTAIAWYQIGCELVDRQFGRKMAVAILLLPPLWFYVFFLLKDMSIVLLQSLFLLGLVRTWRKNPSGAWALVLSATIAIIPFRSALSLQNVLVSFGTLFVRLFNWRRTGQWMGLLFLAVPALLVTSLIITNVEITYFFGIFSEHRMLGSETMLEKSREIGESSEMRREIFPFIYLLSETAGLSVEAWQVRDEFWLRGLLALPWIVFVAPMFLLGIRWLAGASSSHAKTAGLLGRLLESRLWGTPWNGIGIFVASYILVSWIVGDTTRWRLPDMPAIAAIALAAWHAVSLNTSMKMLLYWLSMIVMVFGVVSILRAI